MASVCLGQTAEALSEELLRLRRKTDTLNQRLQVSGAAPRQRPDSSRPKLLTLLCGAVPSECPR
jgi:hypothetical protein